MVRIVLAASILGAAVLGGCHGMQEASRQPDGEELVVLCPKIFASIVKEMSPETPVYILSPVSLKMWILERSKSNEIS